MVMVNYDLAIWPTVPHCKLQVARCNCNSVADKQVFCCSCCRWCCCS